MSILKMWSNWNNGSVAESVTDEPQVNEKQVYVPQDVKDSASSCPSNYSCTVDGTCQGHELCQVSEMYGENILMLKSIYCLPCSYRLKISGKYVCRCPVHYYLEKASQNHLAVSG